LLLVAAPAAADLDPPDSQAIFTVECDDIPARTVEVHIYLAPAAARGTVIFGTSGDDYTGNFERAKTVEELQAAGFDIYVLHFTDEQGWYAGGEGHGLRGVTCGYADAVRWVEANAARPDVMCAQANSGATQFIAYGVQEHGLDGVLDLALVTAGPSATLPIEMCEGTVGNPSPETLEEIDYVMGWPTGTCTGHSPLTDEQRDELLIDGLAYRENLVHRTKIWSMMDETDKSKQYVAAWFDTMIPPTRKRVDYFVGIGHHFDRHPIGARWVRQVLRTQCR
jgi:hypothetical protein